MKIHGTEINLTGMELSKSNHTPTTKKYEMANDQHIRNIVLFADSSKKLYIDEDKTVKIDAEEAARQYFNGIVIDTGSAYIKPTGMSVSGTTASFTLGSDTYTASAE